MSELTIQATDPGRSVVVEACAGSGKTWMLVTRIFRLLMAGAPPDSILAITFTRKAADEMLERLDQLLEQCVLLPDTDLLRLLDERCCASLASDLTRVRKLALEVIGSRRGVEINTFHGWFTSLCQLAPTHLGFSRQAEPSELDGYWFEQAWVRWMGVFERGEAPDDQRAYFEELLRSAGSWRIRAMLEALCRQRAAWRLLQAGQADGALQDMLDRDFEIAKALAAEDCFFDSAPVAAAMSIFIRRQCDDTEAKRRKAEAISVAWQQRDLDALTEGLRRSDGERRSFDLTKGARSKLTDTELADFEAAIDQVQSAFEELQARQTDARWHAWTSAAFRLLPAFLSHFEAVKADAGVIDFDDLEITASDIMADEAACAWVQMRLDRRTQHLLLDEFQDTNPLQWLILKNWLDSNARDSGRTVFMVGDPKQSIYRFRRAEARLFAHVRDWMADALNAVVLQTDESRRCAQSVLAAVNGAFMGPSGRRMGITPMRPHTGRYDVSNGGLTLFPLVQPQARADATVRGDWLSGPRGGPARITGEGAEEAIHVAGTLLSWKQSGSLAQWRSVMVLVRRREDARPLSEALQALAIPHRLEDRSSRFASLLWSDTLALMRVLLSPLNERSLLQLLRSPFFNLGPAALEKWLRAVAAVPADDAGAALRLWETGSRAGGEVAAALGRVASWRDWAVRLPLHEVLERIFRETDIEAAALARAPEQERDLARQHWAWLVTWALDVHKGRLPHPLRALEEAATLSEHGSAAGSQDADLDAVRILTVHGSKGLEADIVWLLAANRPAAGGKGGDVQALLHWPAGADLPVHLSLQAGRKHRGHARLRFFADEDAALADEADHLLYVALTRARHRICVSGTADAKSGLVADSWYERLSVLPEAQTAAWSAPAAVSPPPSVAGQPEQPEPTEETVEWETLPALPPLPAAIGQVRVQDDNPATRRGEAWHACLEHVSADFFSQFDRWWDTTCQRAAVSMALSRIDDPSVALIRSRLFDLSHRHDVRRWLDPEQCLASFNEFEWMDDDGRLHRADRLVQSPEGWVVLDYKWNWSPDDLPGYFDQLKRYGAAIRNTLAPQGHLRGLLLSSEGLCEWVDLP